MAADPAKIIFLNGASSSGKSSIARVLQTRIEAPFWRFSFDHLRDAGGLPLARLRSGEFDWAALRGNFFRGYEDALAAFAASGNNLIIDYILDTEARMRRVTALLHRFDVFFVGVHCDVGELERRERLRGDRKIGSARHDEETIHAFARYDLEIDTTRQAPEVSAEIVLAAWRARRRPAAFDLLARADGDERG
ncbi:MAG TPA: hypothetical protein VG983_02695 [Caulobacterales bacterium]|nr:hypothetical protein [Caulobacterales bacterium]